jgi:hypothetical protein
MTAKTLKASEIILIKKSHLARLNSLGEVEAKATVSKYKHEMKEEEKNRQL